MFRLVRCHQRQGAVGDVGGGRRAGGRSRSREIFTMEEDPHGDEAGSAGPAGSAVPVREAPANRGRFSGGTFRLEGVF
jgi:hypothetical protein